VLRYLSSFFSDNFTYSDAETLEMVTIQCTATEAARHRASVVAKFVLRMRTNCYHRLFDQHSDTAVGLGDYDFYRAA